MFRRPLWIMLCAALTCACGSPGSGAPASPGTAAPSEAAAPPAAPPAAVPSHETMGELPEGHPPIGAGTPAIPPPPPGSGVGSAAMTWKVPEGWTEEPPASAMRRAQYRVPGKAGDAECVVYYFGPGQGGDPRANALRWATQFKQPDGRDSAQLLKTTPIDVGGLTVLLVEVNGTYDNPMVNNEAKPGYMLLGAVAEGPDANWFFKLTGPEATVQAQRQAFDRLVHSLRTGRS
jgi:hypothetical protein